MAVFSGNGGSVSAGGDVAEVTKWTAEESAAIDKFGSSSSGGWKNGVAGTKDIKGSVEAKIDAAEGMPFDAGDSVSMVLTAVTGSTLSGTALIASISYETDIDTGKAVGFTANWEGVGAWSKAGAFAGGGESS